MTTLSFVEEKLRQKQIVLLDGATGTELEKGGVPINSKAWSAAAILTHPEVSFCPDSRCVACHPAA